MIDDEITTYIHDDFVMHKNSAKGVCFHYLFRDRERSMEKQDIAIIILLNFPPFGHSINLQLAHPGPWKG
uniref:Uncharacterized protein n=1 Tax=Anopheles atroparvus TaxID=41427 RepID=A0AAG5D396_ANOAO